MKALQQTYETDVLQESEQIELLEWVVFILYLYIAYQNLILFFDIL